MHPSAHHPTRTQDSRHREVRSRWRASVGGERDTGAGAPEAVESPALGDDTAPSEDGRWVNAAPAGALDSPPLTWQPSPTPVQRILRGLSVPAVVGIIVFIAALGVTAAIMLRSLTGSGDGDAVGLSPKDALTAAAEATPQAAQEGEGAETDSDDVVVHLIGEVREPGVVELTAGARVLDAIEAAGGPTDSADLTVLNLARQLTDGEQIEVFDETAAALMRQAGTPMQAEGGARGPTAGEGDGSGSVNINTASAEQLTQLSGIGPALAQSILDWRETNGRFDSVDQLTDVSGIGAKTLEKFRDRVSI